MPFVRHWKTGELIERPAADRPRSVIARTSVPESAVTSKTGSVWGRPQVIKTLAVPNDQVSEFNEGAALGARYVPGADGFANLEVDSRAARAEECRRRGHIDRDGGYGDNTALKDGWPTRPVLRCAKPTISEIRAWVASDKVYKYRTHYERCWRSHPSCIAQILLDRIDELEFLAETAEEAANEIERLRKENEKLCENLWDA